MTLIQQLDYSEIPACCRQAQSAVRNPLGSGIFRRIVMTLSPLTRYRLKLVLLITIFWVITGTLVEINNALSYDPETDSYFIHFPFGNSAWRHLLITAVGPLLGGLIGGSVIVFILRNMLRRYSFGYKLVVQSTVILALIIIFIMLVGSIQAMTMEGSFGQSFVDVVFTWRVLRLIGTWFLVVIITLLLLDVNEKYGQGVLWRMLTGKYHKPVSEERIFLFMDITDSTGLAERLGDEKFFRMLRGVFFAATEPVLNSEGEISNYVGDELIVSWPISRGLQNANCIECYYRILANVDKYKEEMLREIGVVPTFKGTIHMGTVVTGEIGVIKKDIVFAGDVLNSTARILDLSKRFGMRLLVSDAIYERLKEQKHYRFQFLDTIVLRGKTNETKVYGVEKVIG